MATQSYVDQYRRELTRKASAGQPVPVKEVMREIKLIAITQAGCEAEVEHGHMLLQTGGEYRKRAIHLLHEVILELLAASRKAEKAGFEKKAAERVAELKAESPSWLRRQPRQ